MEQLIKYIESMIDEVANKANLTFQLGDQQQNINYTGQLSAYRDVLTYLQTINNK